MKTLRVLALAAGLLTAMPASAEFASQARAIRAEREAADNQERIERLEQEVAHWREEVVTFRKLVMTIYDRQTRHVTGMGFQHEAK